MKERNEILLCFYGDDFTGSTDVMETLALNGIPTILFLEKPSYSDVKNIKLKVGVGGKKLRAFGVAGIARSLSPNEMKEELDPIFKHLSAIPTDYFHYKICSTLDSSPEVGNIGVASEIALKYFPTKEIPLILGAPFLNRFVVFNNLFARLDDVTYRLDRHPVMSVHPVTPMKESDIGVHLGRQTNRKIQSINCLQLKDQSDKDPSKEDEGIRFVSYDTISNADLITIGGQIWKKWNGTTQLVVGSSGFSYGLARYLESINQLTIDQTKPSHPRTDRVFVASGSCSLITGRQIRYAMKKGFLGIEVDVSGLIRDFEATTEILIEEVIGLLGDGKSVILCTALSADDRMNDLSHRDQKKIVKSIGSVVARILARAGKIRTSIAGGDTSGYVARALGIRALETMVPIAPGAPLCIAHSDNADYNGLEIALKGGQNGRDDYFVRLRDGSEEVISA